MGGRPSPSVLARAAASFAAAGSASPATTMFGAAPAASSVAATPISGMYAMDRSPCGTWLATNGGAGASSSELLLWHASAASSSSASFGASTMARTPVPFARLVSHADVAFGCCWLDERVLLSGSRDGSLAVWRMPTGLEEQVAGYTHGMSGGGRGYCDGIDEDGDGGDDGDGEFSGKGRRGSRASYASLQCIAPAAVRSRAHNGAKVRALCHGNAGSGFGRGGGGGGGSGDRFASLGTDGSVAMWDVSRLDAVASSPAPGRGWCCSMC
jgi:WD40 repeat protein